MKLIMGLITGQNGTAIDIIRVS